MRRVLIVGATSAIAEATARLFAAGGNRLCLAARDAERLAAIADDLKVRGAEQVATITFDALDYNRHESMVDAAEEALDGLDTVLVSYGSLPDQRRCEASPTAAREAMEINALSVISLLTLIAGRFEARRDGIIAVISSVAGMRGRKSNYVYGAAKGALSTYLQGLRHRLHPSGVSVLDVRPGLVDTPMTRPFSKGPLWVSPEIVARDIHRAICLRRRILYTPWFWRWIMLIIRIMPEVVFLRTKL